MTFVIYKASGGKEELVELSSIEDVMNLIKQYDKPLIFYPDNYPYSSYKYPQIMIYNDYIE